MLRSAPRSLRPVAAAAAALALVAAAPAHAKSDREVSYAFERVWPAAVRFVRIDAGHPIEERDAEAGYILFTVAEEGSEFRGALEIVRIRDDQGRDAVRLVLGIEDRPSYMETLMLKRLVRKLRDELGTPPPPEPPDGDDENDGDDSDGGKAGSGDSGGG